MTENNPNEYASTPPGPDADAPLISMGADISPLPQNLPPSSEEGTASNPATDAPLIAMGGTPSLDGGEDNMFKVPTVVPKGGDTGHSPVEEPLSSDTIAMKRLSQNKQEEVSESQAPEQAVKKKKRLKIFCHNCGQKLDLTDIESFSEVECPSCAASIIVPKWFDNYLLEEVCGKGGMSTVYRGLDLALDREVAIKVLNRDVADHETRNKLFLHEARTAATLNHYALLPIYTCGEFEGQAYLVMQFMPGGSLEQEIETAKHSPLPIREIRKWLKDASEGLDNARRHGIIHHDIKPGNLMLDDDRNVKVGDFGISQALYDTDAQELTSITKAWGSPHYVSPEKVTEKKESYLGDIYSLGATFYHVITGHTPFDGNDTKELLKMKTVRDPLHISKLRSDIPQDLAELVMSMMNRTPEARPSYRDIVAELNAMGKGGRAEPKPVRKRAASPAPAQRPKPRPQIATPSRAVANTTSESPRKAGGMVLPVIILLLIGLGAVFFFLNPLEKFGKSGSGDLLPDISDYLAQGNSKMAAILAEAAFKAGEDAKIKSQAAAQMAMSLLLNDYKGIRAKCGSLVADMMTSKQMTDSPERAIVEYLAAKKHEPRRLRANIGSDNGARMEAEVAIFVQAVQDNAPKEVQKTAYKNFMALASVVPSTHWVVRSWGKRMPLWADWLFEGRGDKNNLEHLIASKPPAISPGSTHHKIVYASQSTSKEIVAGQLLGKLPSHITSKTSLNLEELSADWLKAHRAFAARRPRPRDFAFSRLSIKKYLDSLPKEKAKIEQARVEQIMPIKEHFCSMTLHVPYEGGRLVTKSGKTVTGTMMANSKYLSAKPRGGARTRVYWNNIPAGEFAKMLAHYAKLRKNMGSAGTGPSASQRVKEAGMGMLRAAVLCDWYGDYENAAKYAKKAVALDPALKNTVAVMMME